MSSSESPLVAVASTPCPLPWLREIRPSRAEAVNPASGPEFIDRARRLVGDGPVDWIVEVGLGMAERIIREMPEFGGGPEAMDILRMGTESSTLQFLLNLVEPRGAEVGTDEAFDGVRDFVRRGIGLESVLRGVRLGHRGMSESFLAACESFGAASERVAEMKYLTSALFEYMDAFAARMAGRYLEEQVRWSAGDSAARLEMVQAILAGQNPEPAAALRALRYDLRETHIAISAWTRELHLDVDAVALHELCLSLLTRIKAAHRLVIPIGAGRVWAWGTIGVSPDAVSRIIDETALPTGVSVATGTPAPGIQGFRSSHEEAEAIRRILPIPAERSITPYADADLLSLVLEDRDRALRFAAHELGPLAVDNPSHRDLRDTVAVFLDEQGSTHATSARLMVARNTVSYRVRRAEEIMGRTISSRTAQLRAALLIAKAMPREVDETAHALMAAIDAGLGR